MGRSSENAGPLELPENVSCVMQLLPASNPQDLFYPPFLPSLDQPLLNSCFQNLRCREGGDDDFCPLHQANAELKSEQSSLLLKNSELLSQTLLLKLENQRLKRQLEIQLQKKHSGASFAFSSSSLEESSSESDNDEEENILPIGSKDVYTAYDSS